MSTTSTLVDTLPQEVQSILHLNAKPAPSSTDNGPLGKPGTPGPDYPYARLLPSYDQNYKLPPLEPFDHVDPGLKALSDADPLSFLKGAQVHNLTPRFGGEVSGIQLSSLGEREKRSVFAVAVRFSHVLIIVASSLSTLLNAAW